MESGVKLGPALALLAALALAPSAARAESGAAPSASTSSEHWYGYQTLIPDAASLAILAPGILGAGKPFVLTGLGSYALVPPIVHLTHRQLGKAAVDLGLRVSLPLAGTLFGALIGWSSSGGTQRVQDFASGASNDLNFFAVTEGAVIGFLAGMGVAIGLDAAVLAREAGDRPALGVAPPARTTSSLSLFPTIGPTRSGANAGVAGTF